MTTIAIEPLHTVDAFLDCERLQERLLEQSPHGLLTLLPASALVLVDRSGGAILGAYEVSEHGERHLRGCLVDLAADYRTMVGRLTVLLAADGNGRDRVALRLRLRERQDALHQGVQLIAWPMDPLSPSEAALGLQRLGGIAVSYERDLFGCEASSGAPDWPTDRFGVEWWIGSPRVVSRVDRGLPPYHAQVGLDRMAVVTRTVAAGGGFRRLVGVDPTPHEDVLLVEIPADIDRLRADSSDLLRDWRRQARDLFEPLFDGGYIASGFVHEAGRGFHVLERAERDVFLRRST